MKNTSSPLSSSSHPSAASHPILSCIRIMTKLYLDCVKMIPNHYEFHSCIPRDTNSQFQSFQSLVVVVSVIETISMRPITLPHQPPIHYTSSSEHRTCVTEWRARKYDEWNTIIRFRFAVCLGILFPYFYSLHIFFN